LSGLQNQHHNYTYNALYIIAKTSGIYACLKMSFFQPQQLNKGDN